jgi:hypothetical protein
MTSTGTESLRDSPGVKLSWLRDHRWRLVPFLVLIALVVAATIAGAVWKGQQSPLGEGVIEPTAEPGEPLDAACAPEFAEPAAEPWSGDAAAESEAIWQSHAEEIAGYWVEGDDGQVLLGEANWSNLSQAVGRTPLSPERVDAWDGYLSNMRADLAAQGRELYVVIAPAKWQIMPEALPAWMEELRGPGHFAQLQRELPGLPWVDVRAAMAEAAETTPVYAPLNSHWTDYGASVAFGQIAACLRASDPGLASMPELPIDGVEFVADRNEFAGVGLPREPGLDWTVPVWSQDPPAMTIIGPDGAEREAEATASLHMDELPLTTSTPDAPVAEHVLLVRDSTGDQLGPMFQTMFQGTTQIRSSLEQPSGMPDVAAEAEAVGADVVVLVTTQRYLEIVPGVGRE